MASHVTYAAREDTPVEEAVKREWSTARKLMEVLATAEAVELHVPELKGAIFCGHLVADLDSVAGAIGAAALYGGVPARASAINSETEFALETWGVSLDRIRPVEDLIAEHGGEKARICLVDFQQTTQLHPAIKESQECDAPQPMDLGAMRVRVLEVAPRLSSPVEPVSPRQAPAAPAPAATPVVGVIDHHALQSSTIQTKKPIFVDIRPWGSMSTIVAHSFVMLKTPMPREVGGLLLQAILSDTLNLRSPTTTEWDRKVVSMLVQYTGVADVNLLCAQQFKSKSRTLATMSAYALCEGDLKQFKLGAPDGSLVRVAFAVVETTDANTMLARVSELVPELVAVKSELSSKSDGAVDCIFLAIVNIVDLETHCLVAGERERSLASAAGFDAQPLSAETAALAGEGARFLVKMTPGKVSRKADFIPPLTTAVEQGWSPKTLQPHPSELNLAALADLTEVEAEISVDGYTDFVRKDKRKHGVRVAA